MNAEKKPRMKRIGRYWLDRELIDEGYQPKDIFDVDNRVIELPELFDADKRRNIGWMLCPHCDEKTQVDCRHPVCASCGWEVEIEETMSWAA
jgi:hypothetical protein